MALKFLRLSFPALVLFLFHVSAAAVDQFDKQQAMEVIGAASVAKGDYLEKTDILDAPALKTGKEGIIEKFPPLVKFMIGMTILLLAPAVSRRVKLPDVVGLILAGIIFGPLCSGLAERRGL